MNTIITIAKKEFLELIYSKKVIWIYLTAILYPMILNVLIEKPDLPRELALNILPLITCFAGAMEFTFPTMLSEIENRTLAILFVSKVSSLKIIVGKLVVPVSTNFLVGVLSLILVEIASKYFTYLQGYNILNINIVLSMFFVTYITSILCILITLIFPDEKTARLIYMLSIVVIIGITYKLMNVFIGNSMVLIIVLIFIICSITLMTTLLLKWKKGVFIKM